MLADESMHQMMLLPKQCRGFIFFKYIKGLEKESLMIIPKYVSENYKL